jgi:hypothetical protein
MDSRRLDALARSLSAALPRRRLTARAFAGLLAAALGAKTLPHQWQRPRAPRPQTTPASNSPPQPAPATATAAAAA